MKNTLKSIAIAGTIGFLGFELVYGLVQERRWRNDAYNSKVQICSEAVRLADGSNNVIPLSQARSFLDSQDISYKLENDDIGIALRPYLHNRMVDVNAVKSNNSVLSEKFIKQINPTFITYNWNNRHNTNLFPEVK